MAGKAVGRKKREKTKKPVPIKTIYVINKGLSNGNGGVNPALRTIRAAMRKKGVSMKCQSDAYPGHVDLLTITGPSRTVNQLRALISAQVK